jgi:hypothetical protein
LFRKISLIFLTNNDNVGKDEFTNCSSFHEKKNEKQTGGGREGSREKGKIEKRKKVKGRREGKGRGCKG